MPNSFTVPAMMAIIIGMLVVVVGGAEYQFIKTNTLNSLVQVDSDSIQINEDVNFLQGNESATVTTDNTLGFVDTVKLILDFVITIANAIALPITIFTVAGMPIMAKILVAFPLAMALLLGIAGFVRGTP